MPICRSSRLTWLLLVLALVGGAVDAARAVTPNPLCTLTGPQRSGVFHVTWSPDGKWLAASGKSGKKGLVVLWDAAGKEGLSVAPPEGDIFSAVFSPDSKHLVTAGDDNHVRLWDLATGRELWVGAEHARSVYVVAFSPDGRRIASGGGDHRIIIWDAATGKVLHQLTGHTERVLGLVFTPDSGRLISACGATDSNDRTTGQVKVWDVPSGKELYELRGGDRGVITLALSPDGRRLAGACLNQTVCVWELTSGKPCLSLAGHTRGVFGVAFSADGKRLASCAGEWNGDKGEVKLWDVAAGKELRTLSGYHAPVWSVAFSPDGKRLATATGRFREEGFGATEVWDSRTLLPRTASPTGALAPQQVQALWADLADTDAERAYKAVWALRACPEQSVPFLRAHARTPPVADYVSRLPKLIEDLDSEDFATRQRASAELERLGSLAHPALRQAATMGSVEVRLRANALLERKSDPPPVTADEMRTLRAIEVLEMVASPEAQGVLEKLAAGPTGSFVAAEAAAALARLRR